MEIEKNIPMPNATTTRGRPAKYPFAKMEVGDSVFFEGKKLGPYCNEYVAALNTGKARGWKFSGRTVDGGVRIWRVE